MNRRRTWLIATVALVAVVIVAALAYTSSPRPSAADVLSAAMDARNKSHDELVRLMLFDALQPVKLSNCEFTRFGEANDGGYLLCGNLLGSVKTGYSYGIANYDQWGCDVSNRLNVRVHQYDCFDTRPPSCPGGDTMFHPECVADKPFVEEGRPFDTVASQMQKNGDGSTHVVVKMDVEGAEWDSLLFAPDDVLERIDQLALEFHGVHDMKFVFVVERLKKFFHLVNVHFNNHACQAGLNPFPAFAYQVLFVNKRLGTVDPSGTAETPQPLDARDNPRGPDCQGWIP